MMHFVYKLVPPRPTFALDMDETEAELMGRHAAYWRDQLDQRKVIGWWCVWRLAELSA